MVKDWILSFYGQEQSKYVLSYSLLKKKILFIYF